MKTCFARIVCCALILIIAGAPAAFCELPPTVYKQLQDNSPEHLQIKVLLVKTKEVKNGAQVFVEATVINVMRSASNLKVGDVIRIEYFHSTSRAPGPVLWRFCPGPVVRGVPKPYSTGDKSYSPAARGRSFSQ